MQVKLKSKVEFALNIIVVLAIVIVIGIVIKRLLYPAPSERSFQGPQIAIGSRLNVANVDWKKNKKTLLFFLKKDCIYCNLSASLYQELLEEASKRDVRPIAVLPDPLDVGTEYVKSLRLPITEILNGSLASYQVPGTPSIIFADDNGIVRGVWIGMAPPNLEEKMRSDLIALFDTEFFNEPG